MGFGPEHSRPAVNFDDDDTEQIEVMRQALETKNDEIRSLRSDKTNLKAKLEKLTTQLAEKTSGAKDTTTESKGGKSKDYIHRPPRGTMLEDANGDSPDETLIQKIENAAFAMKKTSKGRMSDQLRGTLSKAEFKKLSQGFAALYVAKTG